MTDMIVRRRDWGFGKSGRPIQVETNCYQLQFKDSKGGSSSNFNMTLQQYDVAWSDDRIKDKRMIMDFLVREKNIFGPKGVAAVFDGRSTLWVPGDSPGKGFDYAFNEGQARGRVLRPDRAIPNNAKVTITHALSIDLRPLAILIQGQCSLDGNLSQALNALTIALKYRALVMHPSRDATFYLAPRNEVERQQSQLGGALEAWQGYFSAVKPGIGKVFMNFDRAAGIFKQPGNAVRVLQAVFGIRDPRGLELARMEYPQALVFKRFLKGVTVGLSIWRDRNAKFKVRAVSDMNALEFQFPCDDGTMTSVAQYIERKYQIKLQHPYLPCVQLTKIAWYPLETIYILPGNQFSGKLKPNQVAALLKITTMKPEQAKMNLQRGLHELHTNDLQRRLVASWNLDVGTNQMTVPARILAPPNVVYSDRRGNRQPQQVQGGQWDHRGKLPTRRPERPIDRWFVIVFAENNEGDEGFPLSAVQRSVTEFVRACRDWGITFSNSTPVICHVGTKMDVLGEFRKVAQYAGYDKGPNSPQFVLTLVLNKASPQYQVIKAVCETKLNVPSQNLLIEKLKTARSQYWLNVALKVNVKLRGVNQTVADSSGALPGVYWNHYGFNETRTIIFGADVTHAPPGSLLPSIAGVVASFDRHACEYATEVRAQNSREEIIQDLEGMAVQLIKIFIEQQKGKYPDRIIFYRDGVAESQFDQVCRDEIAALKRCCRKLDSKYDPKIVYIICGKRHHIRMYPFRQEGDRSGNCHAATVIDSAITHPYYCDFYLMSHAGLLGTSRPAHYTVLLNEPKWGPDQLQELTYYLAHVYARSTRSVSIASPAYYAHHVCTRARAHVGDSEGAASEIRSAEDDQLDQIRNQKLENAKNKLSGRLGSNLVKTLYFM